MQISVRKTRPLELLLDLWGYITLLNARSYCCTFRNLCWNVQCLNFKYPIKIHLFCFSFHYNHGLAQSISTDIKFRAGWSLGQVISTEHWVCSIFEVVNQIIELFVNRYRPQGFKWHMFNSSKLKKKTYDGRYVKEKREPATLFEILLLLSVLVALLPMGIKWTIIA